MTNEDIIESVISLFSGDGTLSKEELLFLNHMSERLDISEEAIATALARAREGKGRVYLPTNEADKKRLLYFLVQAVIVEGRIIPEERMILDEIVDMLGISKTDVEDFLKARLKERRLERSSESLKSGKYTSSTEKLIMCPKCGHKQTTAYQCKRCGIIFEKYKQAHGPTDEEKLKEILASNNIIKEEF